LGGKFKKTGDGRIDKAGDFSVIVDPFIWKRLKNYGDEELRDITLTINSKRSLERS
jgi:hypothetical protein